MATLSAGDTISLQNIYSGSRLTGDLSSYDGMFPGFNPSTGLSMGFLQEYRNATAGTLDTSIISMSAAAIDSVDGISGYTYVVEGTSENYSIDISGAGWYAADMFIPAGTLGNSAIWVDDPSSVFGSHYESEAAARGNINGAIDSISAASIANSDGTLDSATSATLNVKYADYVNDHATNYDTLFQKTIYWVDSYDGNSAALCLTIDSPVTLADGTVVEAGDLDEGDLLKGFSIGGLGTESDSNFLDWSSDSLSTTPKDVTIVNLTYSFASRYYDVNNGEVTATTEHPLLVKDSSTGNYMFKEMHRLQIGDNLIKGDGTEVQISSIEIVQKTTEIVSIDVEEEDTYMVNGYITHNKGGDSHTDFAGPGTPTSLNYSSPNVTWVAPSDQTTNGVTAYDIQLDNNSDFSSPVLNETEWSSTVVEVDTLTTSGTWYFRVRAIESGLTGDWASFSFVRA